MFNGLISLIAPLIVEYAAMLDPSELTIAFVDIFVFKQKSANMAKTVKKIRWLILTSSLNEMVEFPV